MNFYYSNSGIDKTYWKPFLLDQDSLRRIYQMVDTCVRELEGEFEIGLRVVRDDDRFYDTSDINQVLEDPNITKRKIKQVMVYARDTNVHSGLIHQYTLYVLFHTAKDSDQVRIVIDHKNLNWSLLTADRLEPLIEKTIKEEKISSSLLWFFYIIILLFGIQFFRNIEKAPDDATILDKLKILAALVFAAALVGATIFFAIETIDFFGRRSKWSKLVKSGPFFVWGEQESVYESKKKSIEQIKWVLVVGTVLSLVANGFTFYALEGVKIEKAAKKKSEFNDLVGRHIHLTSDTLKKHVYYLPESVRKQLLDLNDVKEEKAAPYYDRAEAVEDSFNMIIDSIIVRNKIQ